MGIKDILQTPENHQLYLLLNTMREQVKNKNYDSSHKFAFIEEIEKKYYHDLYNLEGTLDEEGSIIEKFDISIQNYYQIIKKLQEIFDNFIINNNQLLFQYLDSDWDEKDKENIFIYQEIINTIIKELEKNEQIKPSGSMKDLKLNEKQLKSISEKFNISITQLETMSQKEIAEGLRDILKREDPSLEKFSKERELDEKDKDVILAKIHDLENELRKRGLAVIGDEENRKFNLPDIIVDHINAISNITEEEKIASLKILEENKIEFDKDFLEEFENAIFSQRCIMLEKILVETAEKRKDKLFQDFLHFNERFSKKHNLPTLEPITTEEKKDIWDSIMNTFRNMSNSDLTKLMNGDDSMLQKFAENSYQNYKDKQNSNQE